MHERLIHPLRELLDDLDTLISPLVNNEKVTELTATASVISAGICRYPWLQSENNTICTQSSSVSAASFARSRFSAATSRFADSASLMRRLSPKRALFPDKARSSSTLRARFASRTRPAKMTVSSTNGSFSPHCISKGGNWARRWSGVRMGEM